ncbi:ABC transporter substrate-binding protein [Clostridium botulinum]|uniref:Putative aBC transporter substrate-binding lipoprotein n=1 Tax=Clostridium botulinum TaxID=1491 RepID=A0A1L7JNJ5_CLOBO|nr:ABC transporter substrate-binding protein [Clostridium botulinum]APU87045.1 putative aBC transporter substrate-binding lipoprotein [Clostridium botulinum]
MWHEDDQEWVEYTLEKLDEYFNFVKKPNWNNIREIYLHNGGFNPWIDIILRIPVEYIIKYMELM